MSRRPLLGSLSILLAALAFFPSCDDDQQAPPAPTCGVTVEVPNGQVTWKAGETYLIRWSSEGPCGSRLRIELLRGGEVCRTVADSVADTGGLHWTCAACEGDTSGYGLRVTDLATNAADVSDADFVISPVQGDRVVWIDESAPASIAAGSDFELRWSSSGLTGDVVLIELLCDGAACDTIAAAAPNTGSYIWTASAAGDPTAEYAFRISDLTTGASAVTGWTFRIHTPGAITVTSPNGGEIWETDTGYAITWSPAGTAADSVRIELLHDGVVCDTIATQAPGGGQFPWITAGCADGSCGYTVRVTLLASGAADESDSEFCLLTAGLQVNAPNGGENWFEGEAREITWTATGDIGLALEIFLARSGAICDTITLNAPVRDGIFLWAVTPCACPSAPCDTCAYTIRLRDPTTGLWDTSDATFCILPPALSLTSPNGGEAWDEGISQTISWTHDGPGGDAVRIELLLEGVVCQTIADSIPNTGSHAWTAVRCGADTAGYRIRVTDLESGASDTSDGGFRIRPPTLTLLSPNGGEEWIAGGNYDVTWDHTGLAGAAVRIELIVEGDLCLAIAASTPNDGSHTWPAEQCAGDSCAYRVKITDLATGLIDASDDDFCIRSYVFAVLAPAHGDRWHEGTAHEISWTSAETSGDSVRIELLHGGGACATIAASAPNSRSYTWTADACAADTCGYAIRVTDKTTLASDASEGTFCIPPSSLTVTAPADGDEWVAGTQHAIAWSQTGLEGATVLIELLLDGAPCDTIAVAAPNAGTYTWTAAACGTDTCGYQVRVTDPAAGTTDGSGGTFCVPAPRLTVTAPNGGETWIEGQAYSIQWAITGTAGDTVVIELFHEGTVCDTIATGVPNAGAYAWIAANCALATTGYTIRVTDAATGAQDASDAAFTLTPTLAVTNPDGGEAWLAGSAHEITWTHSATYGDSVRVELLRDGTVCDTIAAGTPNDGALGWTAARCGTDSCGYRVRITDLATGVFDESATPFCILPPTVTVLDPDGGELWVEGTAYTITWSSQGTSGDSVRIELLHGGAPVDTLAATTLNDGSFGWTPAQHDRQSTGYRVRITDLTTGAWDTSDATFSIRRDFRVTAPNGSEVWYRNSTRSITWIKTASAGDSVRILLLCAGEPCDTIAAAAPNNGSHPWVVAPPGSDSCGYQVSLTDLTTADTDASDAGFCVSTPALTVTAPDGGEVWDVGSPVDVTWDASAGVSDSVAIELLADGVVCDTIAAATLNDGSHPWTIAACTGADSCAFTVRIRDLALAGVVDASDAPFCILPGSVTITAPVGGEEWYTGAAYTISWTHTETAGATVRLLLVRDGAVRDTIATATANDDSLEWVAERFGGISVGYWITITDLTTGDVDSTGGALRINPGPTLTSPNGAEAWVAGDERSVTWTDPAPAAHSMRLELLLDGAPCDTLTNGTDNDGSFTWTVGQCGTDTTGYEVRIANTNTGGADLSDAVFRIFPDPTVTAPNGGEAWFVGDDHDVTWRFGNQAGAQQALIELRRAGTPCDTLSAATANDGAFTWTAEQAGGESDGYTIVVMNLTTSQADSSDAAFSIYVDPTVTYPNGGEELTAGEDYTITWRHGPGSGGENVVLWLMREGATCDVVAASTANDGEYEWTFAQCGGEESDYKILITNLATGDADSSDAVFTIE